MFEDTGPARQSRACGRVRWLTRELFDACPHPGLLPRGEGEPFAGFLECRMTELVEGALSKQETS